MVVEEEGIRNFREIVHRPENSPFTRLDFVECSTEKAALHPVREQRRFLG